MELTSEKIKNIIKKTIELSPTYQGDIHEIDCFKMFMSASHDSVYKMMGFNICSFNYEYKGNKSVLLIFSTPVNETETTKLISDKVIGIVDVLEKSLITLDYIESKELKEDKQIYIIVVKKVKNSEVSNESSSTN